MIVLSLSSCMRVGAAHKSRSPAICGAGVRCRQHRTTKIALGAFFNHFATKEEIATALVAEALTEAHAAFESGTRRGDSVEEQHIAAEIRALQAHRNYVRRSFTSLSGHDPAP
jgi:hypothetical protein